jgi:hypothetical protein
MLLLIKYFTMKKVLIFVIFISLTRICFSQSLSRNEFVELANRLESLVFKKDSLYDAKRSSQFIYFLASINSRGMIERFDLSGIKTDTIYQILSGLKPADFADWKCKACIEKTIVIPLFYVTDNNNTDQIEQMLSAHYLKIPQKDLIIEVGNTILVKYMSITGPQRPRESSKTSSY